MFSGGLANTTISIYELMKTCGYEVTLLNTNSDVSWWDDGQMLQKEISVVNIKKDSILPDVFDLIIELVPFFESQTMRQKYGKHFVYLFRHNVLIPTIEHSLYPVLNMKANYDGIDQVWCFDTFCSNSEKQILETITRKPVVFLPYVWTPSIVESHRTEHGMPLWIQMQSSISLQNEGKLPLWSPHVYETNITSSSSCTLPLVMLRQAKLNNFPMKNYKIHNSDQLNNSQFFKDNVVKHCNVEDLSGSFVGRQRICDLVLEPMSCVISHVRFIPFKPMLFDMAWIGIPFIHNSEALKHVTCFERYYYPNNKISKAVECLETMHQDFVTSQGWFNLENIQSFRKWILETHSSYNPDIKTAYMSAIESTQSQTIIEPSVIKDSAVLVLLFTDMWENFKADYNFFTLLLKAANPTIAIDFYDETTLPKNIVPNAIIFGPFGESWRSYPSVPKIHFTGENTAPVVEESVGLNLGFAHADMVNDTYLRFPLWILEIDWFNCDTSRIANPKPIPLEMCTKIRYEELGRKKKFCAFVVSNPNNEIRNKAYQWLNEYKPVDSAGRLYNNMGSDLYAGLGGGGGELQKVEFLKDYKYCLCYENNSSQGYVTEKLLHAKAAGCIPIYWGDPKVERDFDTKGFIDARNVKTKEELIELVRGIENDDKQYLTMYEKPILDDYRVKWAQRTMAECANRIFKILNTEPVKVPRFLETPISKVKNMSTSIEDPIVVTYATREFLPSLNQWLISFNAQKTHMNNMDILIYLGDDVPEESKKKLLEGFPTIHFASLPNIVPDNFKDIFEGKHYAWKIYIYQELANSILYKDKMIFYLDAGAFMCRWPSEYLRLAQENSICVLEDATQYNEQWCHQTCINKMKITPEELKQKQIVAGILCFRSGSTKAKDYFNEAWSYAQERDVIVGEKWSGIRNSKPYGHRHDQSILSVLSLRHKLAKYPLQNLYCDISLRRTFITNKNIYVHRGNFKIHEQFVEGIDDCFVINLKRRSDRLERLYKNSPEFLNKIIIVEAYEGKRLQLSPAIARLFRPHDFMWKKAIMGCALSHLNMWNKLALEREEINNYLILEDDVKLHSGWQEVWKEALPHVPENYDVIYLGGILPPNRGGFESIKEPINKYFSRVKENNFFGQTNPNRYFHWCAYSYILSKQGAQKLLNTINAHDGYYTSADHMICNPIDYMNIYFLDPLLAGCYQDDDPVYRNSEFNNFNRVDGFDSDLWNNDERFTKEELDAVTCDNELDIAKALADARNYVEEKILVKKLEGKKIKSCSRFFTLKQHELSWDLLYEKKWLIEMLGNPDYIEIQRTSIDETLDVKNPIFIILRNQSKEYIELFKSYETKGFEYSVIHLSDEYGTDDISYYDYKCCKSVIRNYVRPDLPSKVLVLPLGYHRGFQNAITQPYERTPQIPFRSKLWSFFGTNWNNREAILEPLKAIEKHNLVLYDGWNDPKNICEQEYLSNLLDTLFVPCIGGNNAETYRFYEALECGCIPILVEDSQSKAYCDYIKNYIPITTLVSWSQATSFIQQLYNDKQTLELYRHSLLQSYRSMKQIHKENLVKVLEI